VRVQGVGFKVLGAGVGVWGLGFGVWSLGRGFRCGPRVLQPDRPRGPRARGRCTFGTRAARPTAFPVNFLKFPVNSLKWINSFKLIYRVSSQLSKVDQLF